MTLTVTASYEELVARGREARERADDVQWTEGDLALQVEALPGDERPRDPETGAFVVDEAKVLKRYSEDVGLGFSTIKNYRAAASAWPSDRRLSGVSFEAHRVLNAQEDRFELIRPGMTVREAEAIVRRRRAATTGKPGWNELAGRVGDALTKAGKEMDRLDAAVDRQPNARMQAKLADYAARARALADRLDAMREWRDVA